MGIINCKTQLRPNAIRENWGLTINRLEQLWAIYDCLLRANGPNGIADKGHCLVLVIFLQHDVATKVRNEFSPGRKVVRTAQGMSQLHVHSACFVTAVRRPQLDVLENALLEAIFKATVFSVAFLRDRRKAAPEQVNGVGIVTGLSQGFQSLAPVIGIDKQAVHEQHGFTAFDIDTLVPNRR
jgi:hypothetical protein